MFEPMSVEPVARRCSDFFYSHCFTELSILLQFHNDPLSASATLVLLRPWTIIHNITESQRSTTVLHISDPDHQVYKGSRRCLSGFFRRVTNWLHVVHYMLPYSNKSAYPTGVLYAACQGGKCYRLEHLQIIT